MAVPTFDEYSVKARAKYPTVTEQQIREAYQTKYGGFLDPVRSQGPDFETYRTKAKAKYPDVSDDEIRSAYETKYGAGFFNETKRTLMSQAVAPIVGFGGATLAGLDQLAGQVLGEGDTTGKFGDVGFGIMEYADEIRRQNTRSTDLATSSDWRPANIVQNVAGAVGQFAPMMATGGAGIAAYTVDDAGRLAQELEAQGMDPDEAFARASAYAMGSGALEKLGLETVLGKVPGLSRLPGRVAAGLGEATTELAQNSARNVAGGQGPLEGFGQSLAQEGVPSFIAGALFGKNRGTRQADASAEEEFRRQAGLEDTPTPEPVGDIEAQVAELGKTRRGVYLAPGQAGDFQGIKVPVPGGGELLVRNQDDAQEALLRFQTEDRQTVLGEFTGAGMQPKPRSDVVIQAMRDGKVIRESVVLPEEAQERARAMEAELGVPVQITTAAEALKRRSDLIQAEGLGQLPKLPTGGIDRNRRAVAPGATPEGTGAVEYTPQDDLRTLKPAAWEPDKMDTIGLDAEGEPVLDLDAPNFGLPEVPRTIPDTDPLLQSIPRNQDGNAETVLIDTPERQQLRQTIIDEHFQGREPSKRKRPIAWVMGGGGAAGKGTLLNVLRDKGLIPPREKVVDINADDIKTGEYGTGIPEYQQLIERGDGRAAAIAHEESSVLSKSVLNRAIEGKFDLVFDRTMGNPDKGLKDLQRLKEAGYEIRLYGVTIDPEKAVQRAVKRAERNFRYVPLNQLLEAHRGFAQGWSRYTALADRAELYDTNVGKGEAPVRIFKKSGNSVALEDEGRYNGFARRRGINEKAGTYRQIWQPQEGASLDDAGSLGEGGPAADRAGGGAGPAAQGAETQARLISVPGTGRTFQVRSELVPLSSLLSSDQPGYDQRKQPRDREGRVALQLQAEDIAAKLDANLLLDSRSTADGAPVVGPDNAVESGNGRVMALRIAQQKHPERFAAYQERLRQEGLPADGDLVLIQRRVTPMTDEEIIAYTQEANMRGNASLSSTEQAKMDARLLDESILTAINSGDMSQAQNVEAISAFFDRLPSAERNSLVDARGKPNADGQKRAEAALVAKAYGNADGIDSLLDRLYETADEGVRRLTNALRMASYKMAELRLSVETERVPGEYDIAQDIINAYNFVREGRAKGMSGKDFLQQGDLTASSYQDGIVRLFYRPDGSEQPTETIASQLIYYAQQANQQRVDQGGLFDMGANETILVPPQEIIDAAAELIGDPQPSQPDKGSKFAKQGQHKQGGMQAWAVHQTLSPIISSWNPEASPRVRIVQDAGELPPEVLSALGPDINGATDINTGTVYLVANNIPDTWTAQRILAHEAVGHFGFDRLFGDRFPKMVDQIIALEGKDSTIRKIGQTIDRNYENLDRNTRAAEIIAHLAEQQPKHPLAKRLVAQFRELLRRLGFKVNLSKNDLVYLLRRSADAMKDRRPIDQVRMARELKPGPMEKRGATSEANLIAQHNLSFENLRHVMHSLDGKLPVPSIAITKVGTPMVNFGEVTLLGDAGMIDPRGENRTRVFGADIYSPRYPKVERFVKAKALEQAFPGFDRDVINEINSKMLDFLDSRYTLRQVASNLVHTAEGLEIYLRDRLGTPPERISELKKQAVTNIEERVGVPRAEFDSNTRFYDVPREQFELLVNEASNFAGRDWNRSKRYPDALDYLEQRLGKIEYREKIFKGFDQYLGTKRYVDHTLDNVVKEMKRNLRGGESENNVYGVGQVRAYVTPQFSSRRDITRNKDKLVSQEEFERAKDQSEKDFINLANEVFGSNIAALQNMSDFMVDIARGGVDYAYRQTNQYGIPARDEPGIREQLQKFRDQLRDMPTEYFEAKITKAVDLKDFKAAVVPDDIPTEIREYLENGGIKVYEYSAAAPYNVAMSAGDYVKKSRREAIEQAARNTEGALFASRDERSRDYGQLLPKYQAAMQKIDADLDALVQKFLDVNRQVNERLTDDDDLRLDEVPEWRQAQDAMWRARTERKRMLANFRRWTERENEYRAKKERELQGPKTDPYGRPLNEVGLPTDQEGRFIPEGQAELFDEPPPPAETPALELEQPQGQVGRPSQQITGQRGLFASRGATAVQDGLPLPATDQPARPGQAAPAGPVEVGGGEYALKQFGKLSQGELAVLNSVIGTLDAPVQEQRRGTQPWSATEKAALELVQQRYGVTLDGLVNRKPGSTANAEQLEAYGMMIGKVSAEIKTLVDGMGRNPSSDQLAKLADLKERLGMLLAPAMGYQTEAGRALNILRKISGELKNADDILAAMGDGAEGTLKDFAKRVKDAGSLDQVVGLTKAAYSPTWWDKFYEYWINGLLSGPTTHSVNMFSNAVYQALEATAEIAAAPFSKDVSMRAALARLAAIPHGVTLGLANAKTAFVEERAVLTAEDKLEGEHNKAIGGKLGKIVRLPGRALQAEDEVFKAIAYQGELASMAMEEAIRKNPGDVMGEFSRIMGQVPQRPDLIKAAKKRAAQVTFTTPLGPNMAAFSRILNKTKVGRLIVPFVRTPTNILLEATRYTPGAFALEDVRKSISNGGRDAALGWSRMAIGSSLMVGFAAMAAQGILSGAGPDDDATRAQLMRQGWRPYSIKLPNGSWLKYNRFEPFGMLTGIAADLFEIGSSMSENDYTAAASMLMTSLATNLGDKTFLRGITEFAQAYSDPKRYLERWASSMMASPVPNILGQTARWLDPYQRQTVTIIDQYKARIPGMTEQLAQRMDFAGDPIKRDTGVPGNPFATSTPQADPLAAAMVELGVRKNAPGPNITVQGTRYRLDGELYSSYKSYVQKARYQVLAPLVNSPQFQQMKAQNPLAAQAYLEKMWDKIGTDARMQWLFRNPSALTNPVKAPSGRDLASSYDLG